MNEYTFRKNLSRILAGLKYFFKLVDTAWRSLLKDEQPLWIYLTCGLFVLRLLLGRMVGCFIVTGGYHDDMLMINYANLFGHFITENLPQQDALVKDMGFPLILRFIELTGVNYLDMLALMWFVAAISMVALVRVLTAEKNLLRDVAIFTLVLFSPVAFDGTGTRVYRNAALTPLYFVTLSMMTIIFLQHFLKKNFEQNFLIAFNVIFGLVFTLTYYVKEDGLWLLCCLIAVNLICLVKILFDREQIIQRVGLLMIPLLIFAGSTVAYKTVNKIFFGVYLINNRTEGELGHFQKIIYKIKCNGRNANIWAPTDALAKAFDASATLKQNSALREAIWHTGWFYGDIEKNPIQGDYLGWVMLSELYNTGTCNTVVEQENFLGKVNSELEAAFDAGTLQRSDRFQLVSSMGGMTAKEILSLGELMLFEYQSHITLKNSDRGGELQKLDNEDKLQSANKVLNMDLAKYSTQTASRDVAIALIEKIFSAYSVIQTLLFFVALVGVVLSLCTLHRKIFSRNEHLMIAVAVGNLLLSLVYAFAIAWFSEFLYDKGQWGTLMFYSIGLIPMLLSFYICGTCLLYRIYKKF